MTDTQRPEMWRRVLEDTTMPWTPAEFRWAISDAVSRMADAEARLEQAEGALQYLLTQVDEVERTSVIRESDIYRHAVAVLSTGEPTKDEP